MRPTTPTNPKLSTKRFGTDQDAPYEFSCEEPDSILAVKGPNSFIIASRLPEQSRGAFGYLLRFSPIEVRGRGHLRKQQ
jgi:hypothetical protein